MPANEREWLVAAQGSQVVGLDNLSTLTRRQSDDLCRIVTGTSRLTRALYTNADLSVANLRRTVILTSIGLGAQRGDLVERMLPITLPPIVKRRSEAALAEELRAALPRVLGGLLRQACAVLANLEHTTDTDLPRMADFGQVAVTFDRLNGTTALARYLTLCRQSQVATVEGDLIGTTVRRFVERVKWWQGTATQLDAALRAELDFHHERDWPRQPAGLTNHLKRLAPALRLLGIEWRTRHDRAGTLHTLRKFDLGDERDERGTSSSVEERDKVGEAPHPTTSDAGREMLERTSRSSRSSPPAPPEPLWLDF
jgi:hypothetical protein